ncbi:PREDICTED: putative nuclear matrix constituent protein 1-like protein [Fragaria vesca subsp. vesca]|uniref:putative nuclear matrix constituent protein 1-like protein n=1 Tax=Fragaria vesca subsp. vesca TaxID=101020 RepID=UPI0002C2FA34|nr:PREDICTED: putative nuclear matrix constituent protein 1-like protein [Fragaria vesca subsp. vesca]
MFTPKRWSDWSLTPRTGTGSGREMNSGKAKVNSGEGRGVVLFEPTTPATGLVENGDRDGITRKLLELENELYEYQYNMGLLLIEKKEWSSSQEELAQSLAEARDALKREQASHLIAISEVEKREENLRKALGVEKQCVVDLEKALHETRSEIAEIKFIADSKLAEANALVASIEEKSLELEAKLRTADAKLAEVSRKSSEIESKFKELEAGESALRRDRSSFSSEQEARETSLAKWREDLLEWERKLQEGEERLARGQRNINQREERANEHDKSLKNKEKDLENAEKKIDATKETLKRQEDDLTSRLASLALKEKEYNAMRMNLEVKEKELLALEEKLDARERVEIQKAIDEHNAILHAKQGDFELEIDQKRKSLDEELRNRLVVVEKKESEVNHMEEKVTKREQALEKRGEKFREKEKDYESKMKALKEKEKSIKLEEKNFEAEKKQLLADKEDLARLLAELEQIKADNEDKLRKISEESDRLKVTEEERSQCQRLQSELKQEIDKYMQQKELLLKEAEDLKQQKELFEKEWEELDDKRAEIEKELKSVREQKEEVEKLSQLEGERLKNERAAAQDCIQREREDLALAQESFAAHMEHEKAALAEKVQSEKSEMVHEFEALKRELETDMRKRLEELEKPLRERENAFAEERERELDNVNYLRDVARREMEDIKAERTKIGKERQEADENKEHLERQRVEIRKDINGLLDLSGKLKDQRENFIKEREQFISYVEKLKGCTNCGDMISEFVLSNLQPSAETEGAEVLALPRLSDDYVKVSHNESLAAAERNNNEKSPADSKSPGGMSWLRKCTSKILIFSPGKKTESGALHKETPFSLEENRELSNRLHAENEAEVSFGVASGSLDVQIIQSDSSTREAPNVLEDSQVTNLKGGSPKPRRRGRPAVHRARSVKAVVKDAKAILGEAFETNDNRHQNGTAEDSANMHTESHDDSSLAGKRPARNGRKRGRAQTSQVSVSEHGGNDSEEQSESVMTGQRKKRREKAPLAEQPPNERRYNLRRSKAGGKVAAAKVSDDLVKKNEEVDRARNTEAEILYAKAAPATLTGFAGENGGSTHFVRCGTLADTQDGGADGVENSTENMAVSEANGSTEGGKEFYVDGEEYGSESRGEDANLIEDEDDESEQPGEASIGKKFWTFLTT